MVCGELFEAIAKLDMAELSAVLQDPLSYGDDKLAECSRAKEPASSLRQGDPWLKVTGLDSASIVEDTALPRIFFESFFGKLASTTSSEATPLELHEALEDEHVLFHAGQ